MKNVKKNLFVLALMIVAFGAVSQSNANVLGECTFAKYNAMGTGWGNGTNYTMVGEFSGYTPSCSVMKFDVSEISEPVTKAYLKVEKFNKPNRMFDNTSASNPLTVSVRAATSDVANWASLQQSSISDISENSKTISDDGFYYFDVTSLVNSWIVGENFGLVLKVDNCSSGNSFTYLYGLDNAEGAAPVITSIPEPATMTLLGLGSFLWLRKKH